MKIKKFAPAFLLAAIFAVPAHSSVITVIVEGVFSEYTDPDDLLPFSEPDPGTVFRLRLTYDSATPKFAPSPELAAFAILDISLMIGSDAFGMGLRNQIAILNDAPVPPGGFRDLWNSSSSTETPTGTPDETVEEGFFFSLRSNSPTLPVSPLTSTDLIPPSWPGGWDTGTIGYAAFLYNATNGTGFPESTATATANITSITVIPIPAALWLFGSAIGLLGWLRRINA